jgi:hypothetical protein
VSGEKEGEDLRDPHQRQMGVARRLWWPSIKEPRQWCLELNFTVTQSRKGEVGVGSERGEAR